MSLRPRASAVVPAHDEAPRVGAVLEVLAAHRGVGQVLLVDDGSTDGTSGVGEAIEGVEVVRLPVNGGKAAAVAAGLAEASGETVLLMDADLTGLEEEHVSALLAPVSEGRADMAVGVFKGGRPGTDFAQAVAPGLSGQRALPRALLSTFPFHEVTGYALETALNDHARKEGWRVEWVELRGAGQVTKEEKGGAAGFGRRLAMYVDVAKGWLRRWTRSR